MDKLYKFDKAIFAERIKTARKKQNLTQEALSDLLNVNTNTLAKWESPRNKLTLSYTNLIELVNTLKIDVNYLFRAEPNKEEHTKIAETIDLFDTLTDKEKNIVSNLIHSLIENR